MNQEIISKKKIKIGILLASSIQLIVLSLGVTVASMIEAFPNAKIATLQNITTLPALVSIPVSLIVGVIVRKTGKKIPLLMGLLIIAISGVIPAIVNVNLPTLYLCVIGIGIGIGLACTTATSLIPEYFKGDEQNAMMGTQSAFINIGGMIATTIAGTLAEKSWRNTYFVFLLALILFAGTLFLVPNDKPEKIVEIKDNTKIKLSKEVFVMVGIIFFYGLFFSVLQQNISILVRENNIGDLALSAKTSGTTLSLMSGVGIFVGLFFGKLSKIFKRNALFIGLSLVSLGMLIMGFAQSKIQLYIGIIFVGIGFSTVMPTGLSRCTRSVATIASASAISLFLSSSNVAKFISPYFINPISKSISNDSSQTRFFVSSFGLIILAVIAFIYTRNDEK